MLVARVCRPAMEAELEFAMETDPARRRARMFAAPAIVAQYVPPSQRGPADAPYVPSPSDSD